MCSVFILDLSPLCNSDNAVKYTNTKSDNQLTMGSYIWTEYVHEIICTVPRSIDYYYYLSLYWWCDPDDVLIIWIHELLLFIIVIAYNIQGIFQRTFERWTLSWNSTQDGIPNFWSHETYILRLSIKFIVFCVTFDIERYEVKTNSWCQNTWISLTKWMP